MKIDIDGVVREMTEEEIERFESMVIDDDPTNDPIN